MRKKAEFPMRYIYKENGGKHTALNVGVKQITSELTFIVDSDDKLVPDAIETILQYHKKYKERKDLCGYSFLRRFPDGNINGKPFEPDEKVGTYIECRINADDTQADKAEVFYTRCLKEFPFPEYRNEKFLGEDLVWIRMAMKYQMVHINRAIYVGNYLEDGLTKNRRKNNIRSPYGCMERAKEFMRPELKLKYRLKGAVQYLVYGKFAGEKQLMQDLALVCDAVISDYSSTLFDFSMLAKPAFVCALDYEEYEKKRGFIPEFYEFPFPFATSNNELINVIRKYDEKEYKDNISSFYSKYPTYCDGHSSKRVCDWILTHIG